MTYYLKEITLISALCYSNSGLTSKFHLLRLYKRYYGQTPKQYLIDKRMEQAKEFLTKGAQVSQTGYDIGFDSPSSFSTLFKARVGSTPTEFQKRATFTKSKKI